MMLAGVAIAQTLGRIFLPISLSLYYAPPSPSLSVMITAVIPLFLVGIAFFTRRSLPLVSVGLAWFLVFLLPSVLNIQTDLRASGLTFASDRYAYLPSVGILIALIGLLPILYRWIDEKILRTGLIACFATLIALFIFLTRSHVAVWTSALTLFQHAVMISPASVQARVALVKELQEQKKLPEAFAVLKEGLRYGDDPRLHLAAGFLYAKAGDTASAREQFAMVLAIAPDMAEAHYALGDLNAREGNIEKARVFFEQAIALEPAYVTAHIAYAELLRKNGDVTGAEEQLSAALKIEPNNKEALEAMTALDKH